MSTKNNKRIHFLCHLVLGLWKRNSGWLIKSIFFYRFALCVECDCSAATGSPQPDGHVCLDRDGGVARNLHWAWNRGRSVVIERRYEFCTSNCIALFRWCDGACQGWVCEHFLFVGDCSYFSHCRAGWVLLISCCYCCVFLRAQVSSVTVIPATRPIPRARRMVTASPRRRSTGKRGFWLTHTGMQVMCCIFEILL